MAIVFEKRYLYKNYGILWNLKVQRKSSTWYNIY